MNVAEHQPVDSKFQSGCSPLKRIALIAFLILAATLSASDTDSDENALRQALAKIVFAHQVRVLSYFNSGPNYEGRAAELNRRLEQESLQFQVEDVSGGQVTEILDRKYSELYGRPKGQVLSVSSGTTQCSDGHYQPTFTGEDKTADISWQEGSRSLMEQRLSNSTLRQAMALSGDREISTCSRYLIAHLTATYRGETAQWKALYLLGCSKPGPRVLDFVMEQTVEAYWNADVYPGCSIGSYSPRSEVIRDWLRQNSSRSCPSHTACYEGGKIVVPSEDVESPATTSSTTGGRR